MQKVTDEFFWEKELHTAGGSGSSWKIVAFRPDFQKRFRYNSTQYLGKSQRITREQIDPDIINQSPCLSVLPLNHPLGCPPQKEEEGLQMKTNPIQESGYECNQSFCFPGETWVEKLDYACNTRGHRCVSHRHRFSSISVC